MKFLALLLSDAAAPAEGKTSMLGAGVTRISPPTLPWMQQQFAVVVMLEIEDGDDDGRHRLALDFIAPTGAHLTPTATVEFESGGTAGPERLDGERRELHWTASFNPLPLLMPGVHRFVLEADGVALADRSFVVAEPKSD